MPRKDRTFTNNDLALAPEEQATVVHNLNDSGCLPITFTPDQVEKIICQHMDASSQRQLMRRLITEPVCDGENKTISCKAVEALRTAIDALAMLRPF